MKHLKRLALGSLALGVSYLGVAQDTGPLDIKWSGRLDLTSEYSPYSPENQQIPSTYGYLSTNQQIVVEGIPFAADIFLSSYQASSLNRYSFSFDSRSLKQSIQERIEKRITELQAVPSIGALHERIEKLELPEQYYKLNELNNQIKSGDLNVEMNTEFTDLLKSQKQLARYNPKEYAEYEQYLQLKSLEKNDDYHKQLKWLESEGLISAGEKFWYQFDAIQLGTATPYFSNLDLAGIPVKGYFGAYSTPYFYIAATDGSTFRFASADNPLQYYRKLKAYKVGAGRVEGTHLHLSYLNAIDELSKSFLTAEDNSVAGIDGRIQLFKRKLDVQARSYIGIHTSDRDATSEGYTIAADDITSISGLGSWVARDITLNNSTTFGNAYHIIAEFKDKNLMVRGESRRVDPSYHSAGLAYLQKDLQRYALAIDKYLFKNRLRISASGRLDEDNLNGAKQYTGRNINGVLRIYSNFNKLPKIALTYMPNFYSSTPVLEGEIRYHKSQMFNLASSKSYKLAKLNHIISGTISYNFYNVSSNNFSSITSSVNQVTAINKKLKASLQIVYRQTNAYYYWTMRPSVQYLLAKRGVAHISLRYGEDHFQNSRYALDIGSKIKIKENLHFGLSVIQDFYSQSSTLSDFRVRTSLRATW